MMWKMVRQLALIVLLVVVCSVPLASTAPRSVDTSVVKVAFIYNFAKFIEWPSAAFADAHAPFTLCMFGTDVFRGALPSIQGKRIKGKKLVIKYFAQTADPDPEACHILFVNVSDQQRLRQILTILHDRPVLTVGDMERFAQLGGMINFITKQNKVTFAINIKAAQRAGLSIRSKLLKLATIVKEER